MQSNKLYVGNLNYSVTDDELSELFGSFGTVASVRVIERKGFGFVEMSSQDEAEVAKKDLDGKEFRGRNLRVNDAKPRENNDHSSRPGNSKPFRNRY